MFDNPQSNRLADPLGFRAQCAEVAAPVIIEERDTLARCVILTRLFAFLDIWKFSWLACPVYFPSTNIALYILAYRFPRIFCVYWKSKVKRNVENDQLEHGPHFAKISEDIWISAMRWKSKQSAKFNTHMSHNTVQDRACFFVWLQIFDRLFSRAATHFATALVTKQTFF